MRIAQHLWLLRQQLRGLVSHHRIELGLRARPQHDHGVVGTGLLQRGLESHRHGEQCHQYSDDARNADNYHG